MSQKKELYNYNLETILNMNISMKKRRLPQRVRLFLVAMVYLSGYMSQAIVMSKRQTLGYSSDNSLLLGTQSQSPYTFDIANPITLVNSNMCSVCGEYTDYNPDSGPFYVNTTTEATVSEVSAWTLYQGKQEFTGQWAQDRSYMTGVPDSEANFFVVEDTSSISNVEANSMVIGLGPVPSQGIRGFPEDYNFIANLLSQQKIYQPLVGIHYCSGAGSSVLIGKTTSYMANLRDGELTDSIPNWIDDTEGGWNLNLTGVYYNQTTSEQAAGGQYINLDIIADFSNSPQQARLYSNYIFMSVSDAVYQTIVNQLPSSFQYDSELNYVYTTSQTDCESAQANMPTLVFQLSGYYFNFPADAYIMNFIIDGEASGELFGADKCPLLFVGASNPQHGRGWGLGSAWNWQYYLQLNYNTDEIALAVSSCAVDDISFLEDTYRPMCVGCINANVTQSEPANFVIPTGIIVGGQSISDVAISMSLPFSIVNSESCATCKGVIDGTDYDFTSYNADDSPTYYNYSSVSPTNWTMQSNYDGVQTFSGYFAKDTWSLHGIEDSDFILDFFLVDKYDSIWETFGQTAGIGLGPAYYYITVEGTSIVEELNIVSQMFLDGLIDECVAQFRYSWQNQSQIQFGRQTGEDWGFASTSKRGTNTTYMGNTYTNPQGQGLYPTPGWNYYVSEVKSGNYVVEIGKMATFVSNYPFISLPDYSYNYILQALQQLTSNGFELDTVSDHFSYYRANSPTTCSLAQAQMQNLTLQLEEYAFEMPASAYIIDWSKGNEYTNMFNGDCAFMLSTGYYDGAYGGSNIDIVLGDVFMYQYFMINTYGIATEGDTDNQGSQFYVNYYAEEQTALYPVEGPSAGTYNNLWLVQTDMLGYVLRDRFYVSTNMGVINATIDVSAAYTTINEASATQCTGTVDGIYYSFESEYDPSNSDSYVNQTQAGDSPTLLVNTLYDSTSYYIGSRARDTLITSNGFTLSNFDFFLVQNQAEFDIDTQNIQSTFGYQSVLGLLPSNIGNDTSLIKDLFNQGQLNWPLVKIRYSWNHDSLVQIGNDTLAMEPFARGKLYYSLISVQNSKLGLMTPLYGLTLFSPQGKKYVPTVTGMAAIYTNYPFIDLPTDMYNQIMEVIPADIFTERSTQAPFYNYTNNQTACKEAQDAIGNLQFNLKTTTLKSNVVFALNIPSTAYMVNFFENQGSEYQLFGQDKCVLMFTDQYFADQIEGYTSVGLGNAFLWQFYTELDFNDNTVQFGVNYFAEPETSIWYKEEFPDTVTENPVGQGPQNFLVKEPIVIGNQVTSNITYDLSSPYSTVNMIGCSTCFAEGVTPNPPTYDPTLSTTFTNLTEQTAYTNAPYGNEMSVNTLYNGQQTSKGAWCSDDWSGYTYGMGNYSFFLVSEVNSLWDAYGASQVIGMAPPPPGAIPNSSYLRIMAEQNPEMYNSTNFKMQYSVNSGAQVNLFSVPELLLRNSNGNETITFNNTVNSTVGGWNFNATALSYNEYTRSYDGVNARIYSNYQLLILQADYDAIVQLLPEGGFLESTFPSDSYWEAIDESNCIWAQQNLPDLNFTMNGYWFNIPANGGYVLNQLDEPSSAIFGGSCVVTIAKDPFNDGVIGLGNAFLYGFTIEFEMGAVDETDQFTVTVNQDAAPGTSFAKLNEIVPDPETPSETNSLIIWASVGGALLLILIIIGVYCYRKKKAPGVIIEEANQIAYTAGGDLSVSFSEITE